MCDIYIVLALFIIALVVAYFTFVQFIKALGEHRFLWALLALIGFILVNYVWRQYLFGVCG